MSACPSCEQEVRPFWPTCRSCGTLLMAAPAPVVPIGTAVEAPEWVDDQFFAPAVLQPITHLAPEAPPRAAIPTKKKVIAAVVIATFVVGAGATAWSTVRPGASAGEKSQTPVVLAPRTPTEGLPTSLDVIVRVEAESTRHTALETIEAIDDTTLSRLATVQPDYQWIAANQPSTSPKIVSVGQNGTLVTIAVDASNHDVCAFGQWSPTTTPVYVTMAHETTCSAANAPSAGWSTEPGGAASDLPDDEAG